MKSPSHALSRDVDDALLAPWFATRRIAPQEARLFAAARAADLALEDDLAAARAEYDAVAATAQSCGTPSIRPLLALFAAIDAEEAAAGRHEWPCHAAQFDPARRHRVQHAANAAPAGRFSWAGR